MREESSAVQRAFRRLRPIGATVSVDLDLFLAGQGYGSDDKHRYAAHLVFFIGDLRTYPFLFLLVLFMAIPARKQFAQSSSRLIMS